MMKIAFLGTGNMGAALLGGLLQSGAMQANQVVATARSQARAEHLHQKFGVEALAGENQRAIVGADLIVLAAKPATVPKILLEILEALVPSQVVLSLAAALPISAIEKRLPRPMAVVRAMPNIPVIVEEGATAICFNRYTSPAQIEKIEALFRSVGVVCRVDEEVMDVVTAMSGSGPAYIYMVIEAMIAGGVKMGLSREIATRLAEQTVLGAAKHVRQSQLHPAILRDEVITPGGTTIVAIHELERNGLRATLISAIESATKHAHERGKILLQKLEE
jgi:pyrroline-5-carboxylate reductase